jgi:hypothetical protein
MLLTLASQACDHQIARRNHARLEKGFANHRGGGTPQAKVASRSSAEK